MTNSYTAPNHSSIWITANAGSGKTTFLTRRVVSLLLAGVVPERICCITYTKAAASEMRHRVLSLLRELLLADDDACHTQVSALLDRPATEADIALARGLFGAVLDSTSGGLQLTTIHGFCQNILRRFPLEADIAPHFTVLEDGAAKLLLTQAKHRLLNDYQTGDTWLDWALQLIGTQSSEARFDSYTGHIISHRGQWDAVWRGQTPELLRARLFALHGLAEDANDDLLAAEFCACVDADSAAIIHVHLPMLATHRNQAEQEIARVLTGWLELDAPLRRTLIPDFCLLFLTKEGEPRKRLLNAKEFPEGAPLRSVLETLAAQAIAYHRQSAALACAQESFAVAVLARALLTLYAQAKAGVHALDYDDLIGKTRELFANQAMLGWVMSKLDHRIDHLLIDEAQDTGGEQWGIAQLLVEELIAANDGLGSGNLPRSLLVVGDEKQSIYSFQGAAPEIFATQYSAFERMLTGSAAPLGRTVLATSYRSAAAVLRLVDRVAAHADIATALSAGGVPVPHQLHRTQAIGQVTLYPPIIGPETESLPPLTMPMEYHLEQSPAQLLADTIADTLAGWLAAGRQLESEGRALLPGDVLVLVHRRKPIVLPLIRALQRRGIPVAGLDRLTLSEHLAVRDLLALMRWALNPADDLSLAHVLRSPLIGLNDEALRLLCIGRERTLWAQVEPQPLLNHILANRHLPPYEFLTDILEVTGGRQRFAARFGEEVHEVLDELKAQAAAMPPEMPPTLAYFYDWTHSNDRQIKREQESAGSGRVRIMTVHAAKGLEAPVVILADTVSVPTTQRELVYFAPDAAQQLFPLLAISEEAKCAEAFIQAKEKKSATLLAEYYRLLYVALTRARDELHIWGIANAKGVVKSGSWYAIVEEALHGLGAVAEDGALRLCDLHPTPQITSAREAKQPAQPPILPAWATSLAPKPVATARMLSPSQLVPEVELSPYAQAGGKAARARGVCIHRMLELLTATDNSADIARLARLAAPEWSEQEWRDAAGEVEQLRAAEPWIWAYKSHAEVSISGSIPTDRGALPISGQIDRLVDTPEALVILDYKTGRQIPASAAEIPDSYRFQLKAYKVLIQALHPEKPVRCAILWTVGPRLIWCDDTVDDAPWPQQFAA